MILGIDKDCVVWTSRHTRFATDTDRFVEIDDPVGALEHCGGGTGDKERCMRALIAQRHLMRAPRLWENTDIDVLDVGARDANGHDILRLARGGARMATDTTGVIDH